MGIKMKDKFFGDIIKFIKSHEEPYLNLSEYKGIDKLFFFDMSLFLFIVNKLHSSIKAKDRNVVMVKDIPEKEYLLSNDINSWFDFAFFMQEWRKKNECFDNVVDMERVTHIGLFKDYYDEFFLLYKKFPSILWANAITSHKIENVDGTEFYFIDELEDITMLIAMNAWVKHLQDRHDVYFNKFINAKECDENNIKNFTKTIRNYVVNGLPEGYRNIQEFIADTLVKNNIKLYNKYFNRSNVKSNLVLDEFRDYMANVPKEDNPTRPREFVEKIQEIERNER